MCNTIQLSLVILLAAENCIVLKRVYKVMKVANRVNRVLSLQNILGVPGHSGRTRSKDTSDGSTVTTFNPSSIAETAGTPAGWINSGVKIGWTGQYISKMAVGKYGLLPCVGNGSGTTYYCDALWANSSNNRVAIYGGYPGDGSGCGAFACHLDYALSHSYWSCGASPSSKPNVY